MNKLPKFDIKNPTNKEEKLIVEFKNLLDETTEAFIRLNFDRHKPITRELFFILRDSCLNYAAGMIADLNILLNDGNKEFLDECKDIFNHKLYDRC